METSVLRVSPFAALAAFAVQDDAEGREGEERRSHQLSVQAAASQPCERKPVACIHNVEVKVPKAGGLRFQKEQSFGDNLVPEHYHHVKKLDGVLVNYHFYGVTSIDFGRAITATVEIFDKIIGERCFSFVNIRKTTTPAELVMKTLVNDEGNPAGGVLLAGTEFSIYFLPRK